MHRTKPANKRGDRLTAEERREAVIEAAIAEFSVYGLHGASTEAIARRAGISQPYIFRLFGTKNDLFLRAVDRVYDRVMDVFRQEAASGTENLLGRMGAAFVVLLLSQRQELRMLLQAYAASSDDEVQAEVRGRFAELYEYVSQVTGATDEAVRDFMAHGMLLIVAAAIDLPELAKNQEWARRCLDLSPL